jgi:hypothetical protein
MDRTRSMRKKKESDRYIEAHHGHRNKWLDT